MYDTIVRAPNNIPLSVGTPQGSVTGSLLWNVMYDGILKLKNPKDTTIIGYADDIAIVFVAKKLHEMEPTCASMISSVTIWFQRVGLEMAEHKPKQCFLVAVKKWRQSVNELQGMLSNQTHIKDI